MFVTRIKSPRFIMVLICVLTAFVAGSSPSVQAAASQIVLSNVPQVGFSGGYNSNYFDAGTRFSVPAGNSYTLNSVSVQLVGSSASFSAFLYDTPGALPGTLVSQIGGAVAVNTTGAGAVTPFVASVPITLQANHSYMIVLTGTGTYGMTANLPTGIFTFQSGALYDKATPNWASFSALSLALSIVATPQLPPTASFTFVPTDLSVAFTDTSTDAPNTWSWDFGDGGTSTAQNPTHVYSADNTYTVCLTASNNYGVSAATCQQVSVSKPAPTLSSAPDFAAPPPVPLCNLIGGGTDSIVRASIPANTITNGDVFCRVLYKNSAALTRAEEIGNQSIIQRGVIQAVDVFGLLNTGTPVVVFSHPVQVCLQGSGTLLFLDAAQSPRTVSSPAASSQGGYTCASIPNAGTVVLVNGPAAPAASSLTGPVITLSACQVTTKNIVNLRSDPSTGAKVLNIVPFNTVLRASAKSGDWYQVVYESNPGWINAQYLTVDPICGQ